MKKITVVNDETSLDQDFFNTLQDNVEEVFNGDISMGSIRVEDIECKNIFDDELELGSITTGTGTNETNTSTIRSKNYIEVKSNTTYTISNSNNYSQYIFEYDSSKTFIRVVNNTANNKPYTFTTSPTTKYIKFRTRASETENDLTTKFQVELGNTATPYTPHKEFGNGIIESGSNDNGSYIKFASGDMICRNKVSVTLSSTGTQANGVYYNSNNFTYPKVFIEQPIVVPMLSQNTGIFFTSLGNNNPTKTTVQIRILSIADFTNTTFTIGYIAIGKWKTGTSTTSEVTTTSLEDEES